MKFLITNCYHHKNMPFLIYFCKKNGVIVTNIDDADVIFSGGIFIPIQNYPQKKFIFGPHFSQFPNNKVLQFNNSPYVPSV